MAALGRAEEHDTYALLEPSPNNKQRSKKSEMFIACYNMQHRQLPKFHTDMFLKMQLNYRVFSHMDELV
jgi:hypothetical protein